MRGARCLPVAVVLASLGVASVGQGEPSRHSGRSGALLGGGHGLKASLGVAAARRGLQSDDERTVSNALRRLASLGSAQALELLIESLLPGGSADTAALRLVAVRGLAEHTGQEPVRRALVLALAGNAEGTTDDEQTEGLVRGTAAMALAASEADDAVSVLGRAVADGGPRALAAEEALLAYPPRRIELLLPPPRQASARLVALLGRLLDQRSFEAMRRYAMHGTPEVRAAAALGLMQIGSVEPVELAEHWLKRSPAEYSLASLNILAMARSPTAARALGVALAQAETREAALAVALEQPNGVFARPLIKAFDALPEHLQTRAVAALGLTGDVEAVRFLSELLARPQLATSAAYALALMPREEARAALEGQRSRTAKGTVSPQALLALQALVLRQSALGGRLNLTSRLEGLLSSKQALERAIGAWGLSALEASRASVYALSDDLVIVQALANNAQHAELARALGARLQAHADDRLLVALAPVLYAPEVRRSVPLRVLERLLDLPGAPVPLVAQALFERMRASSAALLSLRSSSSREVRASAALGLGRAPAPFASAWLIQIYQSEGDPVVRRAALHSLALRRGKAAQRVLREAAKLEPDAGARRLARLALAGGSVLPPAPLDQSAWLDIRSATPHAASSSPLVLVQSPLGDTRALRPLPNGSLPIVALPSGPMRYAVVSGPEPLASEPGTP